MNYRLLLIATASTLVLAGCSSSGDGGTASLAAAVPTAAGETAFESGQQAIQSLSDTSEAATSENLPTFNLDGSVGRASFSEPVTDPDTGNRIGVVTINGEQFTFNLSQNTNENGGVFVSEDGGLLLPTQDTFEEATGIDISSANVEVTPFITGTDFDNDNEPTFTGAGFVIDGNLTAVDNLPAQATYSGGASVVSLESIRETTEENPNPFQTSDFTATATFGQTNTLEGSLFDQESGNNVATIEADITGNTFSGTITGNGDSGSTSLDGGFFGPNANEIAGAGSGVVDGNRVSIGLVGTRTDNMPVN